MSVGGCKLLFTEEEPSPLKILNRVCEGLFDSARREAKGLCPAAVDVPAVAAHLEADRVEASESLKTAEASKEGSCAAEERLRQIEGRRRDAALLREELKESTKA